MIRDSRCAPTSQHNLASESLRIAFGLTLIASLDGFRVFVLHTCDAFCFRYPVWEAHARPRQKGLCAIYDAAYRAQRAAQREQTMWWVESLPNTVETCAITKFESFENVARVYRHVAGAQGITRRTACKVEYVPNNSEELTAFSKSAATRRLGCICIHSQGTSYWSHWSPSHLVWFSVGTTAECSVWFHTFDYLFRFGNFRTSLTAF